MKCWYIANVQESWDTWNSKQLANCIYLCSDVYYIVVTYTKNKKTVIETLSVVHILMTL